MQISQQLAEQILKLKNIGSDMKALIEWQKLKAFERTHNPSTNLFFHDDTRQQLFSLYNSFLAVFAKINDILKDNVHLLKYTLLTKELNRLYAEIYYLGTDVRVY